MRGGIVKMKTDKHAAIIMASKKVVRLCEYTLNPSLMILRNLMFYNINYLGQYK